MPYDLKTGLIVCDGCSAKLQSDTEDMKMPGGWTRITLNPEERIPMRIKFQYFCPKCNSKNKERKVNG